MINYIKNNKTYFVYTVFALGLGAFLYYITKEFNSSYHLIGSKYDLLIPFIPLFIYPYNLWYPFEAYTLFLVYKNNLKIFYQTIISIILSFISSTIIFIVYPTTIIRPTVDSYNSLTSFVTYLTFKADTPVNCFPSNHCILCFIMIFSVLSLKNFNRKYKLLIVFGNFIIILSTLFTKQHVMYDILGSLIIAVISFYILSKLVLKKLDKLI